MFDAESLTKSYHSVTAIEDVSLHVDRGEVFGLLGSNGAGKTTILKVFATLLRPDAGRAAVAGISVVDDPLAVRARIGYVPESPELYPKLTGREFLHLVGALRGMPQARIAASVDEIAKVLRLDRELTVELDACSRGMRQKVALASAMFPRPEALILDEPTDGLDPRYARALKDWLRAYADAGGTVLLSTHATEVAAAICDRIAIVHDGRIRAVDTVHGLLERTGSESLEDAFIATVGGL